MSPEDWLPDDPFLDPEDPESVARAKRRAEREAKRRRRRGETGESAAVSEPPPSQPAPPLQPPPAAEPAAPSEPPPAAEPAAPSEPAPAPEAPAREPAPARSATPAQPPPAARAATPAQPPPPAPAEETPSVLAGAPRAADEDFWEDDEIYDGDGQEPPSPGGGRGGVGRWFLRRPWRIALAIVAILVVVFAWALFQPFHGSGSGAPFSVKVPKGSSVSEIGDLLESKGVISNSTLFQIRVTLAGKRSELYPGNHEVRQDMSYSAAIDSLSQPPVRKTVNVLVPEGLSRRQIAALARQDGLAGSYLADSVSLKGFDPNAYGAQGRARNLEGFLFPATYEMPKNPTARDLVVRQIDAFEQNIKGVEMSYAKKKNLTVYDVLIIASMIEDEAGPKDYRNVASVIYNRLHQGIPLGIDATIRFAVGNYTSPLTESELATDSPYNTRLNQGLPPGPIGNPGLAAIRAAANPARNDYLYYVTKPGSCNRLTFSSTDAQFQRDVDAYNQARAAAGGNSPTNCG